MNIANAPHYVKGVIIDSAGQAIRGMHKTGHYILEKSCGNACTSFVKSIIDRDGGFYVSKGFTFMSGLMAGYAATALAYKDFKRAALSGTEAVIALTVASVFNKNVVRDQFYFFVVPAVAGAVVETVIRVGEATGELSS